MLFEKEEDITTIVADVKRAIGEAFQSTEGVVKFMGNEVTLPRFNTTIEHILPKRFTKKQREQAWNHLIGNNIDAS